MNRYFLTGVAIFVLLGVSVLIPAHVTEPNLLGYYSLDPLAPVIAILLWIGGWGRMLVWKTKSALAFTARTREGRYVAFEKVAVTSD